MTAHELVDGVLSGDRAAVGRAVTLVESTKPDHRADARRLLDALAPHAGGAQRVGVTGVPGVGKSTFIEALGSMLTAVGHRVAVLAVDPTSTVTGGSILGDKTRMPRLSNDPSAFVRPSPSAGTLGGVTRSTRETLMVLEAAGHDVVLVETVGIGQSETVVAAMVDFFLVLMLPGAGDELQGIKKGVLEMADLIAVNKADGDNVPAARTAVRDYSSALRLTHPTSPTWNPPVMTCSGQNGDGLEDLWGRIVDHRSVMTATGEWDDRRRAQRLAWMWSMVEDRLLDSLRADPAVLGLLMAAEAEVLDGLTTPSAAAERLLEAFGG
ncbi:MAG: methylmalonyl Co-A mutase-associated GTPase MeaB [Acidimicrobiales bacterium]|nr:methylmalonyl Co-A mutase-associated GTPase MeaB [Acidimicrobiaceae bacterium]MBT5207292.1 methylmalonyl Co-A mutase-associated GTPase MeaB [Acidimicrobiaceae bacterium]MBT5568070.1 methylmalonyl Co-A mutase-associated GTPase MeaB [Acidimicrobiaceae bacterium]MBT6091826.1 methylmalonyl Co-A mutase-associated GTPase MeaB [Acidimicrobiaceae bacterium]MDG2159908.1 methylmalonyl Co-A mutase-associated GTPase MeaB [Acidimicrobiales bacterium]